MTVADLLLIAGLLAGGASILGLGAALLASSRGSSWHDGYRAGQASLCTPAPQPPAPVIVLTQPPAEPVTVDATWKPVQPAQRRFVVVGEPEQRRLDGR